MKQLPIRTEAEFREWCRRQIEAYWNVSASTLTLRSFYFFDVEKPKTVTARMFDWLRSVASNEIQIYKSTIK